MNREEIKHIIVQERLVAIVRLNDQSQVQPQVKSLINGGVKVLEITSNTPGFLQEIETARKLYPNILIGAGTVTNSKIAIAAIKSGAQFLVSPNTNLEVISIAHQHNIPVLMGACTPTEICEASDNGADIIKLFPAGAFGLDYFKAVKGPLDSMRYFIVGGVDLGNIDDWITAGASGFGMASTLTKPAVDYGLTSVEATVQRFLEIIKTSEWKD